MSAVQTLPHWDMDVVYSGLDSPEFQDDFEGLGARIDRLGQAFDHHAIRKHEDVPVDAAAVEAFESIVRDYGDVLERLQTLRVYIQCLVDTDSHNDLAQARLSELQQRLIPLFQLGTRLTEWIGSLDVEALIAGSSVARDHQYLLRRTKIRSQHLMTPAEEDLATALNLSGGTAWSKLYDTLTSQITATVPKNGESQDLPISLVRNLAFDPDREVRRAAYEAELAAWQRWSVPIAAALNSIKGQTNTLEQRRGWESALDVALFYNSLDRETLEAMLQAAREAFPDFRRYLRAKARTLGLDALAWFDLFAPVGHSEQVWDFDPAMAFLQEQFGTYSDRLRNLASRALTERWIDAEPHEGKSDGAYCVGLRRDESRILANYTPSYDGMSTLAHELGHAYHNFNLATRPILQRSTPMALAETASIFCQTIVREAALERADAREQMAILEASLQDSCQVIVDITSRFLFERGVFERRSRRELSVEELKELMLETQRETYGDGLDGNQLHPFMWAAKGHYYSASLPFYNFPYMFGLLFGLGLYARYQAEPEEFRRSYDDLLSSTGTGDAADLAGRFGIDIRAPAFWRASIDIVRRDIDRFEALAGSA